MFNKKKSFTCILENDGCQTHISVYAVSLKTFSPGLKSLNSCTGKKKRVKKRKVHNMKELAEEIQ